MKRYTDKQRLDFLLDFDRFVNDNWKAMLKHYYDGKPPRQAIDAALRAEKGRKKA